MNKSPLLIRVFELVKPNNMRCAHDEQLPDRRITPPEYDVQDEAPNKPEGDLKDWEVYGIDKAGNRIRIYGVEISGLWENGFRGTVKAVDDDIMFKYKLEDEA